MSWLAAPEADLARLLLQRGVALVYALAFANVLLEWPALLGDRGLLPVREVLARSTWRSRPSLLHWRADDRTVRVLASLGLLVSLATVAGATSALPTPASVAVWLGLWALYLSFVTVGRLWYAFGWESLLCEAGFLVAFLGADDVAPPWLVLLALRWLVLRVEVGAGLIKLRGDPCWRDLTCLEYHHETQPLPGPLSRRFHLLPRWVHRIETGANHVVQLVVPLALFAPQPVAGVAAALVILTQGWLVVSGNFAWLNLLTIVLACSALPDAWAGGLAPEGSTALPAWAAAGSVAVAVVVVVLSVAPVRNLLSSRQRMNATFNRFHLGNAYGAFGSVTRVRHEVVVEGSDAERPGEGDWRAYGFWAKPTDPSRRPPQVAPFHLRLDWLLWFAAMAPAPDRHPWVVRLLDGLLAGDHPVRRLLRLDPFPDDPPRWVRATRWRYRYTTPDERRATGDWWHREPVGTYVAPRSRDG